MEPPPARDTGYPTTFNILFVCTGNTCRSPMAEVIARHELARRGWSHVRVSSAGAAAAAGSAPSEDAVAVMERRGMDLSGHGSRPLTSELVDWADLILAMGPSHLHAIADRGGEHKMALLGDFADDMPGRGRMVRDPYGGVEADYEEAVLDLEDLVPRALDRLVPILHP